MLFPKTNSLCSGIVIDSNKFLDSCTPFLYQISNFCGIVMPDICAQVNKFVTNALKPVVGVSILFNPDKITVSQICANSLFVLQVTVAVLTPSCLARRAISTFALVLPVEEIKQYVLSFLNVEFNRSDGL